MKPADIKDMVFYRGVSGHDRAIIRRYREMVRGEPVDSVDWQAWPDGVGSCLQPLRDGPLQGPIKLCRKKRLRQYQNSVAGSSVGV